MEDLRRQAEADHQPCHIIRVTTNGIEEVIGRAPSTVESIAA
jgi:hypothetical protein